MKNSIGTFLAKANNDENVWIDDVREAFSKENGFNRIILRLFLLDGTIRDYPVPIPGYSNKEEYRFLKDYLTASVFNILSVFSGTELQIYYDMKAPDVSLLIDDVLSSFDDIPGLHKPVNIAGRLCRALNLSTFAFAKEDLRNYKEHEAKNEISSETPGLSSKILAAVKAAEKGLYVGLDIGGTDIKAVLSKKGKLLAVKEYDWNPMLFKTAEELMNPIYLITNLLRAYAGSCDYPVSPEFQTVSRAMRKEATDHEMLEAYMAAVSLPLLNGIGISFPDVVIKNKILGGETPKTKGIRENKDADYNKELSELAELGERLKKACTRDAKVNIINDGSMSAFSTVCENIYLNPDQVASSAVAYSLGTDLGTGWIRKDGTIPGIPLECYDMITDIGSYVSGKYESEDIRSVKNENSGLQGCRRYLGQAAAYRLIEKSEPELIHDFATEENGIIKIKSVPQDMRKPCLEHIMSAAENGDAKAEEVFRQIGINLGHLTSELEHIADTGAGSRSLFGRFVKKPHCFELLKEGFSEVVPEITLEAADDSMACTPLMKQLSEREDVTVAQFAQAVSAVYYSLM